MHYIHVHLEVIFPLKTFITITALMRFHGRVVYNVPLHVRFIDGREATDVAPEGLRWIGRG